jgi:hypothetical protein
MLTLTLNEQELKKVEQIIKTNGFANLKKLGSAKLNTTNILVEKTKTFTGGSLLHTVYFAPYKTDVVVFTVIENDKTKCHRLIVSSLTGELSDRELKMLISKIAKATQNELE